MRSDRRDIVEVFEFMTATQATCPIEAMARVMNVSRSGFYAWRHRAPSQRDLEDGELVLRIKTIHKASKQTHGAPRIHAELAAEGIHVGRKRVERLMRTEGLVGVSRRKGA